MKGFEKIKTIIPLTLTLLLLGLFISPARAATFTVCASGCSFTTIQAAITAASNGDTIKVAQGTYNENLLVQNKGVHLIGGYAPPNFTTPSTNPSLTIIDASGKGNSVIRLGSGVPGQTASVENFTIRNGSGWFDGSTTQGGGIRVQKITATVRNNIIENNSADAGGGIHITDDNNPLNHLVENNIIRNNIASNSRGIGFGGGIDMNTSNAVIRGNTIAGNQARCGGGMVVYASGTTIERNIISNNQANFTNSGQGCAGGDGGGIFIELVNKSPVVVNNLITSNQAAASGDGIIIAVGPGQPQIVNNTIANNKNSVGRDEAIFYVGSNIVPVIRNNIIALNGTGIHRGVIENVLSSPFPVMSNNLVWGNNQTNYLNLSAGSGDISADPLFVNSGSGDYQLQTGSSAIDAGTSTNAPTTDLTGQSRPLDGNGDGSAQWDMGAYEFAAWLIKTVDNVSVDPGDTVHFTLKFQNNSSSTATGVTLTDALSSHFDNISYTSSGATVTPQGGAPYTWSVQNLTTGQSGIITITARVKAGTSTPLGITNAAQLSTANVGTYSSQATIIVGGLKTYLPLVLKP